MEAAGEAADVYEAMEAYHARGWTDGLPVVPPTAETAERFLEAAGLEAEDAVFHLAERRRTVRAGKVALNAVMAGCLPAYMPVILAALEAMADPAYNLHSSATSTGGAAPFMVVNGPVRREIGLNMEGNIYGPGSRAGATIGRALRLVIINCLGSKPGLLDRSTQGNPGKYSFTFAEWEEKSPWEPLSADLRHPAGASAVTLLAAEGPHNIQNHYGRGLGIARTAAATMAGLGSMSEGQSFFVFAPEHAHLLAEEFPTKRALREYLFENATLPLDLLLETGKIDRPVAADEKGRVRHALAPEDIHVVVAGGEAGGHSSWVPSWSRRRNGEAVTRPVLGAEARRALKKQGRPMGDERRGGSIE